MARPPRKSGEDGRALTPDEAALWRAVMGEGAAPDQPSREPMPAQPSKAPPDGAAGAGAKVAPPKAPRPPRTDAPEVQVERGRSSLAGLDRRNAQRLRRGQMKIEARLDLHGMTREVAHRELGSFLAQGAAVGRRCVLVITGKGTPREAAADAGFMPDRSLGVLRKEVRRWLAEPEARTHVVAWAPAIPRDGGDGALYVLLRRKRR